MHKLDLVLVHINHSRHTLSKWLAVSFNDLVLLSGQDIRKDKEYTITYRYEELEDMQEFNDMLNGTIQLSHGMELFVNETGRTLGQNNK